jgi:prepilin-type N-terminal cleavage/methylation domain-containing protein
MNPKRNKGFSLIELLVVVAVLALLLTILMPSLGRARTLAKRSACAANLRGIGQGLIMYFGEYDDFYPWAIECDFETARDPRNEMLAGGHDEPWGLINAGELNVLENLNLLVYKNSLDFSAFLSPAADVSIMSRDGISGDRFGFKDAQRQIHLTYAYHTGYKNQGDVLNPAPLTHTLPGDFVVMANRNAAGETHPSNKWDHGSEGVNVLRHDGSVTWETTTNCQSDNGNIFTDDSAGLLDAIPSHDADSVLHAGE